MTKKTTTQGYKLSSERYNEIRKKAETVLLNHADPEVLPISPLKIAESQNIKVKTLRPFNVTIFIRAIKRLPNLEEVRRAKLEYENQDGYTVFSTSKTTIYYNPQKGYHRNRWTLAHELGHYFLNHQKKSDTEIKDNYLMYEAEADFFARCLLVPFSLLYKAHIDYDAGCTVAQIEKIFDLNRSPAMYAHNNFFNLLNWNIGLENIELVGKFESVLKNKFRNFYYCETCGLEMSSHEKFCLNCGGYHIKKVVPEQRNFYDNYIRGYFEVIHPGIVIDEETGKAKICPVCQNEETNVNGEFCQICGAYLVNRCSKCDAILSGNARYCNTCGEISSFFANKFLKSWKGHEYQELFIPEDAESLPF